MLNTDSHRRAPIKSILTVAMLLIAALPLTAQAPAAVPVPSQFATANTVFLASGSAPGRGENEPIIAQMVYRSVYKSMSATGRYKLVSTPADAEISMVISTQSRISSLLNGTPIYAIFLYLEIYDIKTHTLIWVLDEPVEGASREKTFQKNVDQSVAALMVDLNALADGKIPGDTTLPKSEPAKTNLTPSIPRSGTAKTRLSDKQ